MGVQVMPHTSSGLHNVFKLKAWIGPEGSRKLRLPQFLDNQHMKVARLSTQHTPTLVLTYVRSCVDTRARRTNSRKTPNVPIGN
jgi:hypothetical protein